MLKKPVAPEPRAEETVPVNIRLDRLQKSFGAKQVLTEVDLTIQPGQFVAIVGKSGSGKSTLLRLIAGLEKPTGGQISFNGQSSDESDANMTMMYQDSRLLPWKTVINNVGLGLSGDWHNRAESVLESVGLLSYKEEWPSTLSGGQQQRVALARALIRKPQLLMLDEPLSALDALTRIEMQNLIEELQQENGFTALLVTHDVREAVRLADRILLIENGTITLDVDNYAPRPRDLSSQGMVALEKKVLSKIMGT
ncbi:ATP-binding cassette domain-containing protein [Alteribacter aurantiacus]|uniref:ATP-binding cassette domain-containing protein n=1 Tax=Alteribacter aurantiacus TaxID=254410 RepID=UPI0004117437|nr:ATP-binding cassette domain-containing protein [Alteribacter aurantiacus]